MSKQEKVVNKGYTIKVVSWENDGDNYRTKSKAVSTLEEMEYELQCIKLSINLDLGNSMDGEAFKDKGKLQDLKALMSRDKSYFMTEDDEYIEGFTDIISEYTGHSEFYDFK